MGWFTKMFKKEKKKQLKKDENIRRKQDDRRRKLKDFEGELMVVQTSEDNRRGSVRRTDPERRLQRKKIEPLTKDTEFLKGQVLHLLDKSTIITSSVRQNFMTERCIYEFNKGHSLIIVEQGTAKYKKFLSKVVSVEGENIIYRRIESEQTIYDSGYRKAS
jgi:hypothetical protein